MKQEKASLSQISSKKSSHCDTISPDRRSGRCKYGVEKPKSIWMEDATFTCFSGAVEVAKKFYKER